MDTPNTKAKRTAYHRPHHTPGLPDGVEIGARIRDQRRRLGLTQKDLADKVPWKANTVSRHEAGLTPITTHEVEIYAEALLTSVDKLLGRNGAPAPKPIEPGDTKVSSVGTKVEWVGTNVNPRMGLEAVLHIVDPPKLPPELDRALDVLGDELREVSDMIRAVRAGGEDRVYLHGAIGSLLGVVGQLVDKGVLDAADLRSFATAAPKV